MPRAKPADIAAREKYLLRRAPDIIAAIQSGATNGQVAARFDISLGTLRDFLSRKRQRRSLVGEPQIRQAIERPLPIRRLTADDIEALHPRQVHAVQEEDEEEEVDLGPNSRLRKTGETNGDDLPEWGEADLPGYAAWHLVHEMGSPLKAAARELGLRYPSDVLDLLAKHKRALDARRAEQAAEGRAKRRKAA